MFKLTGKTGDYRFNKGKLADADLVIDHKGTVIKERHGMGNRPATRTELNNAELVNAR